MKKMILALGLMASVSSAGAASYVGLSGGYPVAGIHYQTDTVGGANRFTLGYGYYGGLDVSYERLTNIAKSSVTSGSLDLQPYWGIGGTLGVGLGGYYSSNFSIGANALVGAKFNVLPELSVFGEVGVGMKYWLTSSVYYNNFSFVPDARVGINYRLK